MKFRYHSLFLFLAIFLYGQVSLFAGLASGTKVLTPHGLIAVEQLAVGSKVISYDACSDSFPHINIADIKVQRVDRLVAIRTAKETVYSSPDQLFFDNRVGNFISAEQLTSASTFLTKDFELCRCLGIELIKKQQVMYDLVLERPYLFFSSDTQILSHNLAAALAYLPTISVVGRIATIIACMCGGAFIKDVNQAKVQIACFGDALCEKYKHDGKNKKFGIENIKQQIKPQITLPTIGVVKPDMMSYRHMLSYPNQYGPLCIMAVTNGVGDVVCVLLTWRFKYWEPAGNAAFGWDQIGDVTIRRDDPFVKEFVAAEDKKELDALRAIVAKWPPAAKAKLFQPKTTLDQEARALRPQGCGEVNIAGTQFGIHAIYRMVQKNISPLLVLQALKYGERTAINNPEWDRIICALPKHDVAALFDYGCKKVLSVGQCSKDKEELKKDGEKQEEKKDPKSDIDELNDNKIKHILEGSKGSNHKWEQLVPDKNWEDVKKIIKDVLTTGTDEEYKGDTRSKLKKINDKLVEVIYIDLPNGTRRISNAWIR